MGRGAMSGLIGIEYVNLFDLFLKKVYRFFTPPIVVWPEYESGASPLRLALFLPYLKEIMGERELVVDSKEASDAEALLYIYTALSSGTIMLPRSWLTIYLKLFKRALRGLMRYEGKDVFKQFGDDQLRRLWINLETDLFGAIEEELSPDEARRLRTLKRWIRRLQWKRPKDLLIREAFKFR